MTTVTPLGTCLYMFLCPSHVCILQLSVSKLKLNINLSPSQPVNLEEQFFFLKGSRWYSSKRLEKGKGHQGTRIKDLWTKSKGGVIEGGR